MPRTVVPRLIVTQTALVGLARCRRFLEGDDARTAIKAADRISQAFARLSGQPEIGRKVLDHPFLRELIVPFGGSGYVALYRYSVEEDAVYVLAFRHQREAGY